VGEQLLNIVSNVISKIKEAKREIRKERWENGKFKARATMRDYWNQTKDFILIILLLNTLIGVLKQVDIFEPRIISIQNVQASTLKEEVKEIKDVKYEEQDTININEIVGKVYRLESSAGKNDSCRNKGLYNGYGYAQHKASWNCYETPEEVRGYVEAWFKEKLNAGYTVEESLCYYNVGIKQSNCEYVNKFNTL
jgi:hypothetical protein